MLMLKNVINNFDVYVLIIFISSLSFINRYLSLALIIIYSLMAIKYKIKINKFIIYIIFLFFLLFLIMLVGLFNSISPLSGFRDFFIYIIYFIISITLYILISNNKVSIVNIFWSINLSALIISLMFLSERILELNFSKHVLLLKTNNHLVFYISVALIMSITMYLSNQNSVDKNKLFLFIMIYFLSIVFINSRGAYLSIIIILPLIFIYNKCFKLISIFIISIFVLMLFFQYLPIGIQRDIKSVMDISYRSSNLQRLAMWESSLNMAKRYPIVGVGVGNWRFYNANADFSNTVRDHSHAHSFHFHVLGEMGFVGLLLFWLIFIINIFYSFISILNYKDINYKDFSFMFLVIIIFTIIFVIFNNPLYNSKPAMLFYIIIGANLGNYYNNYVRH